MTPVDNKSLPKDIDRIKMLLLLLYAPGAGNKAHEPVRGRTRLQKQAFLVQQELKKLGARTLYSFRPYRLGPMSYEIYNDLDWLKFEGTITEIPQLLSNGEQYSSFALTEQGVKEVKKFLQGERWAELLERVTSIKQGTNSVNLSYLVESVHEAYPEYMLKASLVRLLDSFSASTGIAPTKVTAASSPRRLSAKTSVSEEIRAIRSRDQDN